MKALFSFSPETYGRWAGLCIGSLFSPSWFLLKAVLSPYISLELLLSKGLTLALLQNFYAQFNALEPSLLLGRIVPMLTVSLFFSMGYLFICGWLGQRIARLAAARAAEI